MPGAGSFRKISAVVVDDSLLMRMMVRDALERDGDISVTGLARDTSEARALIKQVNPDVVTLDVEMPGMNGLEFLEKIMTLRPMPVIMVSSLTARGADATLAALEIGAVDVAQKPHGKDGADRFGQMLREKVRMAAGAKARARCAAPARRPAAAGGMAAQGVGRPAAGGSWKRALIAIGASTGGVAALSRVLSELPRTCPPIVIAQHMPPDYTGRFSNRLAEQLGRDVAEAKDGEIIGQGAVRIAPGDYHLEVHRAGPKARLSLSQGPPVSGHRPSVDVLFRSVARAYGADAVGVILTGMGRDGAEGLREMRQAGAHCLGQGPESCVVYGMPKAAAEIGALNETRELSALPSRICTAAQTPSRATGAAL
ncbi:protein-glutamate methylesterase/protein-glutamine glutaminase [Rhodovulum sp. DZ06]|uniref:protein-glutamate methylesterase/protein-glutamine glutaminase n=1 Tax=Rhodovulum sp. DZ06 TaxID=3425126 RepID=UPI003D334840